jgi:hypothetical protein
LVLGLPTGLLYHLLFCLASSILLFLWVYRHRLRRPASETESS